jgi:Prenylcysteine lyase
VLKFLRIYELQDAGVTFPSAHLLWRSLGLDPLMQVSVEQHLREAGRVLGVPMINRAYIAEVVAAQTRVNYNQDPTEMTALTGHIALAADGTAFTVRNGTSAMPRGLLRLAAADVQLGALVEVIERIDGGAADGSRGAVHDGCGAAGGGEDGGEDSGEDGGCGTADGGSGAMHPRWRVRTAGGAPQEFDIVVIAAPLSRANITLRGWQRGAVPVGAAAGPPERPGALEQHAAESQPQSGVARSMWEASEVLEGYPGELERSRWELERARDRPGAGVRYQTVFTTYVRGQLRPEYFGMCDGRLGGPPASSGSLRGCLSPAALPGFIGTTQQSGVPFSCIGTAGGDAPHANGTRLVKLFSVAPLKRSVLDEVFTQPRVLAAQFWKAYPVFTPPETQEGRMKLAPGLYYTNALEAGASCIEIAAVAARNVAMMVREEVRGRCDDVCGRFCYGGRT